MVDNNKDGCVDKDDVKYLISITPKTFPPNIKSKLIKQNKIKFWRDSKIIPISRAVWWFHRDYGKGTCLKSMGG